MIENTTMGEHISFEEMSDFVFGKNRPADYMNTVAKYNHHIFKCDECAKMYDVMMSLKEEIDKANAYETPLEKVRTKVFRFLCRNSGKKTAGELVDESKGFGLLLSFNVKSLRELIQNAAEGFSHPKIAVASRYSASGDTVSESESTILSCLDDGKNRVSIGMDGTLSLYFDATEYEEGKRVILIPDDEETEPVMQILGSYDDGVSYALFEGVEPGEYAIVVEK